MTENRGEQGGNPFEDAEVIVRYTRAQAIEDGVLVDVSQASKEAGLIFPVAVTRRIWAEVITPSEGARKEGQSESGRLWDVLWMLRVAIKASRTHGEELHYGVFVRDAGRSKEVELKAMCGPGDDGKPVVTIMYPEED